MAILFLIQNLVWVIQKMESFIMSQLEELPVHTMKYIHIIMLKLNLEFYQKCQAQGSIDMPGKIGYAL